uniref:Uncharacterized protein n=1 Tax=Xiphophorus couchianus TaxID=32473 RepID=A0A3B5KTD9_9TELE
MNFVFQHDIDSKRLKKSKQKKSKVLQWPCQKKAVWENMSKSRCKGDIKELNLTYLCNFHLLKRVPQNNRSTFRLLTNF